MNTRLVLWGEIKHKQKNSITIHLEEEAAKLYCMRFQKKSYKRNTRRIVCRVEKWWRLYLSRKNTLRWK